jgi:hypothetical protein
MLQNSSSPSSRTSRCGGLCAASAHVSRTPIGMLKFAPAADARGGMFSARRRLVAAGADDVIAGEEPAAAISEADLSAR